MKRFKKDYCPTKEECFHLLEEYCTPEHVRQHCNAVSETAKAIAQSLNKKGLDLNVSLISSAGYLHDIARVEKNHEEVGGDYLSSLGLEAVAALVRLHKVHKVKRPMNSLKEVDILCIADRVVLQSHYVGPVKRMAYIKSKAIKKFGKENEGLLDEFINDFINFVHELETFMCEKIYDCIPPYIRG